MDCITTTLSSLAPQINEHHERCLGAAQQGVQHALAAGRLLIEAKGLCPHGTWGDWLDEHFHASARTAQAYMRLANNWLAVQAKAQSPAHLTIDGALELITDARPEKAITDATSDASSLLPALTPGHSYFARGEPGSFCVINQSATYPGYWYMAHYHDMDTDNPEVVYTAKPWKTTPEILAAGLRAFGFVPSGDWVESPASPAEPWFVTAIGTPGRARVGAHT